MSSERFLGKVAMITGAANGIGLATVKRFAEDGADIVGLDLHGVSFDECAKVVADSTLTAQRI